MAGIIVMSQEVLNTYGAHIHGFLRSVSQQALLDLESLYCLYFQMQKIIL